MPSDLIGQAVTGARNLVRGTTTALDDQLNETTIRLAVTGLSRAGKTVFITSLIQNLLALGQGRDTLPLINRRLNAASGSRLRSVRVVPAGVQTLAHFDFAEKLAELSADLPSWPPRTCSVSTRCGRSAAPRRSHCSPTVAPTPTAQNWLRST